MDSMNKGYPTIILDPGHGGVIDGEYITPGKRSPIYPNGMQLFEGVFNRYIADRIHTELGLFGIPNVITVIDKENNSISQSDVPLQDRVSYANTFPSDSIYISIHSNAGGGSGYEVWKYPGSSLGQKYADIMIEEYQKAFSYEKNRGVKDSTSLYVLSKTRMPAILTENFFMDNPADCIGILMESDQRERIVDVHVSAIKRMVNYVDLDDYDSCPHCGRPY